MFEEEIADAKTGAVDEEKFQQLLGAVDTMTYASLRKAYYEKSRRQHPDKGGSSEKF